VNGRDAHKKLCAGAASLSLLSLAFLLFLLPLFLHLLAATAKESAGAFKLIIGSGRSPAAKRHLVNFGLKECFW